MNSSTQPILIALKESYDQLIPHKKVEAQNLFYYNKHKKNSKALGVDSSVY